MAGQLIAETTSSVWGAEGASGKGVLASGETRVAGWAFMNQRIITGGTLLKAVAPHTESFERFRILTGSLNGHFALIVYTGTEIWLACSLSRNYPLFYARKEQSFWAGDSPLVYLRREGSLPPDGEAHLYFLQFGVTPAARTLARGLRQVRPGETVRLTQEGTEKHYFSPDAPANPACQEKKPSSGAITGRKSKADMPLPSAEEDTAALIRRVFARYVPYLTQHKILLPLTGGYDSRLLACLLKEAGHKEVLCATWGRPGNQESAAARSLAEKLGFPHLNVDYTPELISRTFQDPRFGEYIDFAGHLSSMPFLQDFPAIRHLLECGAISPGTRVLPGHPGDFLRGSHLYSGLPEENPDRLFKAVVTRFGTSYPMGRTAMKNVAATFRQEFPFSPDSATETFRNWDLEERQCKLITNSVMAFEFFGLQPVMPLYDPELIRHFGALPFSLQLGGLHYFKTLNSRFFRKYKCELPLPGNNHHSHPWRPFREWLIRTAPHRFKQLWYPVCDDVAYREMTEVLMRQNPERRYRHPDKNHFYNCYLTQWYLFRAEEQIK